MNLWVKRTGQFFIAALFLMSCEDDSFLLGFKNQNKKFNVRYQEISFSGNETSVLLIDSILTDHYSLSSGSTFRFLSGQYVDPLLGTVQAKTFTQFQPSTYGMIDATGATFDSAIVQFHLDYYAYGFSGDSQEKFAIHRITEDSLSFFERYYYNSSFGYESVPLGEATFDLDYFDFQRNLNLSPSSRDTMLIRTMLDVEFGAELFSYASSYDSALIDNEVFRERFKGLVIVPSQNNYILGINPTSNLSKLTLYYHTNASKLERSFFFSPFPPTGVVSFNNVSTLRSGDLASMSQPYEMYAPPSNMRYIQNGSPVITKLDLTSYYNFIRGSGAMDSLQEIVINAAELIINIEAPQPGLSPPSTLALRVLKKVSETNYQFMNRNLDEDDTYTQGFYLIGDDRYYLVASDNSSGEYATLTYDKTKQRYKGNLTIFTQNLFDRKSSEEEILYLGLYPATPIIGKSVERVAFKQENIKLGIYYTKPALTNID